MFPYTVQHIFVLRLLKEFPCLSTQSLHNLLFLASASQSEPQELGFYDFVRIGTGAFSPFLQVILCELRSANLIASTGCSITAAGQIFCCYHNISLAPFRSFWESCAELVDCCGGDPENLKQFVFCHLSFRRVRLFQEIFSGPLVSERL